MFESLAAFIGYIFGVGAMQPVTQSFLTISFNVKNYQSTSNIQLC